LKTFAQKVYSKRANGFTLIEILVSMALLVFILLLGATLSNTDSRQQINETLDAFDRAIRFASSEATLKNTVVRLKLSLDKKPQQYSVEYSTDTSLRLIEFKDTSSMSIKDREAYQKKQDQISKQFSGHSQFAEIKKDLDDNIKILGMGTTRYPVFVSEFEAQLYLYPSGEKDGGLIIFASDSELAALYIYPFSEETEVKYFPMDPIDTEDAYEREMKLIDQAKGIFQEWQSE